MKNTLLTLLALLILGACSETIDNTGTCHDGILNQGEQQVDCGGPCLKRCESCADGIMNQGETAVDCGGPCDPCYPRMSARIDSTEWWSTSRNAYLIAPDRIRIYGSDALKNISLNYSGPFHTGTVPTGTAFTAELMDESGITYTAVSGGSITFTTFDTISRTASGTFTFTATEPINGNSLQVTSGVFNVISW